MDIKKGDIVRVSKDIPQFYRRYNSYRVFEVEHQVVDMVDGLALLDSIPPKYVTTIPTKYLIKVDAEVGVGDRVIVHYPNGDRIGRIQEVMFDGTYDIDYGGGCTGHNITRSQIEPYAAPKFKVGDRVKFKNIYELQKVKDKSFRWMLAMFASKEATITAVEDNGFYRVDIDPSIGGINDDMIECKIEPIAPKFKVGNWVMISGVFNPQLNGMIGWISRIDEDGNKVSFQDGRFAIVEDKYLTLITQPTEQTEEEKKPKGDTLTFPIAIDLNEALEGCDCFVSIREQIRKALRDIEKNNKPRYVPKIMFNTEFWVKYEADLAKELAISYAKRGKSPLDAVAAAKEITKRLKQK